MIICDENNAQAPITSNPASLKECVVIVICSAKTELQEIFAQKLSNLKIKKEKIRFYTDCFYISYWLKDWIKNHFEYSDEEKFIQMLLSDTPYLKNLQKIFKNILETIPKPDKDASFYDDLYLINQTNAKTYKESIYYLGWEYAQKILSAYKKPVCVLDIGCGTGDFGKMLYEKNIKNYLGIDFSLQALKIARKKIPSWEKKFIQEDIFTTDKITKAYTHICIFEVLEHINQDLEILKKILPKTNIIASVPNFYSKGHVRIFENENAIRKRYTCLLDFIDFFELPIQKNGAKIFYFHALKK